MNISSVDPNLSQVALLRPSTDSTRAASRADANGAQAASSAAASASLSPLAQLLSQLQQLQQTNPSGFRTVLTDIAGKLQAAAQQDGGTAGQALSGLASRFQQAAQTGDLSSLQPHHHHHGHHHRAAAAYQPNGVAFPARASGNSQSVSSGTDVRSQVLDIITQVLNQDLGTTGTTR